MSEEWRFVPAELDAVLADKGHNALLGHRYHAHGEGWIEMAMPWQDAIGAADGLARGAILALLDNTAGVSVWLRRGGYLPQVTIDLRADYLRPTRPGADLICRSHCVGMTEGTAFAQGFAYDDDPSEAACLVTAAFALL